MLRSCLVVVASLATLAACISVPPFEGGTDDAGASSTDTERLPGLATHATDGCVDEDGDGYLPAGCRSLLPPDCAPSNELVHPGARELCGNSTDDNCSHPAGDPDGDEATCPPNLRPNSLYPDANGTWVNNDYFHAWFSPWSEWSLREMFPLVDSGDSYLALGSVEQTVGVLLGPSTSSVTPAVTPSPEVLASGRAVYRLRVNWSSGGAGELAGETIYTVTPEGKIHMHQRVTVSPGASGTSLSLHMALDPARVSHADWSWNAGSPYELSSFPGGEHIVATGTTSAQQGYACAYQDSASAAVGLSWKDTTASSSGGPRIVQTDQDGAHLALRFDWFRDEAVPAGEHIGKFMLYCGSTGLTRCERVQTRSQTFRLPPVLVPDGNVSLVADDTSDGAFYPLRAADETYVVSFSFDTQSGTLSPLHTSLFRIDNFPARHMPVVWLGTTLLEHGVDYLIQTEGSGDRATLWLFVGRVLSNGDRLTIRSPRD